MNRIFQRKVLLSWDPGPHFMNDKNYNTHAGFLTSKVLCPGDVLVFSVKTDDWVTEKFSRLVDVVMDMVDQFSLHLVWLPESWGYEEDTIETWPSHYALKVSDIKATTERIAGPAIQKYKNHPRVTIINDTDFRCNKESGLCDIWVPGSRTVGYWDRDHFMWTMGRYLEPFYCSILKTAKLF